MTAAAATEDRFAPADAPPLLLAPLRIEARAARAGFPSARVRRTGMGPRRAREAPLGLARDDGVIVIVGFCGALDEALAPGDVIVANELRTASRTLPAAEPGILAGALRAAGLRVHVGPIACSERIVRGAARQRLVQSGALAVDMESAWLAQRVGRPVTTVRVVVDTPARELYRPLRTIAGALRAYRSLRTACAALERWSAAARPREVILASPRASCAGVVRAVAMVERALDERGSPVYVRRQIVHNAHVVADLERRGAIFVSEIDEVPNGATVVFSAHGVSPVVRADARDRGLDVVDATCPLVAKVHAEARRFAASGYDIVLIGHLGHEEVDGTVGEAPERIQVIANAAEIERLAVADPGRVAYLTQTTLAIDETAEVVDALRERYPALAGPASDDICYATQNRQDAVKALAADCDLVLVVGSENSSNSRRLVEVAQRSGCRALLVGEAADLPLDVLAEARRIGVTAGASAPEAIVQALVAAIDALGGASVTERATAHEDVSFKLPQATRERK